MRAATSRPSFTRLNAPANDVFDSKDPRGETVRLRKARREFDDALSVARTDLEDTVGTPEVQMELKDGETQGLLRPADAEGIDYRYVVMPMRI